MASLVPDPLDTELRQRSLGTLSILPDCLITYILYQLDLLDVARATCTSRLFRLFCCEEPLWLDLCLRAFEGKIKYLANWRQTALSLHRGRTVPEDSITKAAQPAPRVENLQSLFLYKRWYRCHVQLAAFLPPADQVERVDVTAMSPQEFLVRYDEPCKPCIMLGVTKVWPEADWQLDRLQESIGDCTLLVSKPHGGRCQMAFKDYIDYIQRQHDEEPLYIFDPNFVESAPILRKMYDVPHVFAHDYLETLGAARPPYRWLVLGPARAGAAWHVDPSLTSAWNALLQGRKRWALYPPHQVPPGVKLAGEGGERESDDSLTSLQWFLEVYPTLPHHLKPIEFIQNPGETVFVPGGWWHAVLNLEPSVAVTQNYVSDANLERVIKYMAYESGHYYDNVAEYYSKEVASSWASYSPVPASGTADADMDNSGSEDLDEDDDSDEVAEHGADVSKADVSQKHQLGSEDENKEGSNSTQAKQSNGHSADRAAKKARHAYAATPTAANGNCVIQNGQTNGSSQLVNDSSLLGLSHAIPDKMVAANSTACQLEATDQHNRKQLVLSVQVKVEFPARTTGTVNGTAPSPPTGTAGGLPNGTATASADAQAAVISSTSAQAATHGQVIAAANGTAAATAQLPATFIHCPEQCRAALEGSQADGIGPLPFALWQRNRPLGLWLRKLWSAHPELRLALQEHMDCHLLRAQVWKPLLTAICRTSGLPVPSDALDCAPLAGANSCVFLVGRAAIKIYWHEEQPVCHLMSSLEAHCSNWFRGQLPDQASSFPATLAHGVARVGLNDHPPYPYAFVIAERCEEPTLKECMSNLTSKQQLAVARALGELLGRMHSAAAAAATAATATATAVPHNPAHSSAASASTGTGAAAATANGTAAATASSNVDWQQLLQRDVPVWHDRDGNIWVCGQGQVAGPALNSSQPTAALSNSLPSTHGLQAAGCQLDTNTTRPENSISSVSCKDDDMESSGCPSNPGPASETFVCTAAAHILHPSPNSPWSPFIGCLCQRRLEVMDVLRSEQAFPPWLMQQVESYLPSDPSMLLGLAASLDSINGEGVQTQPQAVAPQTMAVSQPALAAAPQPTPVTPQALAVASHTATVKLNEAAAASHASAVTGTAAAAVAIPRPLLLHGDLTSTNVLVSMKRAHHHAVHGTSEAAEGDPKLAEAGTTLDPPTVLTVGQTAGPAATGGPQIVDQQVDRVGVKLIDFADAGFGDPLYELVAVTGSCLQCSPELRHAFWEAYTQHGDVARTWIKRPPTMRLSYVAMCYSLLHEEDLVFRKLSQGQPGVLDQQQLEEVEQALWGWLNG